MKFLKYLIGIILLIVIVGLFLPATTHVERETLIQAPPQVVFGYINDYRKSNQWSPWFERDPEAKYEYSGPTSGVGSKMHWESEHREVGSGSQEIVESKPYRHIKVALDFGAQGQSEASWDLTEVESATRVVWSLDMAHGWDLLGRIFGLMMDAMVGPDYEAGLENLKQLAEADVAG